MTLFGGGPHNSTGSASRWWNASASPFPDPFCDIASMAMPRTMRDALWWSERIAVKQGVLAQALRRVVSYFITEVELTTENGEQLGHKEKQEILDFLNDDMGIAGVLESAGVDFMIYGNSFTSLVMPFKRSLMCRNPACSMEVPLRQLFKSDKAQASYRDGKFYATCPRCKHTGEWRMLDRRSNDKKNIAVHRWSPHEIDIRYCPTSQRREYLWRIPTNYRSLIKDGRSLFHLESVEECVLEAIHKNEVLLFNPDAIHHMFEPPPAGVTTEGWGFSRMLTNFGMAYYVQILMRYNEAIALDFVVPTRVITPMPRPGAAANEGGDPLQTLRGDGFSSFIRNALQQHRMNPADYVISPYPLQYQLLSGEANELAPRELVDQGMELLLASVGIPAEMFKGTLTTQAAVPAMRQFEANWQHLVFQLNRTLRRIVDGAGQRLGWKTVKAKLRRASHADDLNRQMAILQLMTQGSVSMSTGFRMLGLDVLQELRNKSEEAKATAEIQADADKDMQQATIMDEMTQPSPQAGMVGAAQAGPGAQPGGAMAPQAGGPVTQAQQAAQQFGATADQQGPVSLHDLSAQAESQANMVARMQPAQREAFLRKLRQSNETMHSLVTAALQRMDQQLRSDSYAAAKQQQTAGQPAPLAS